MKKESHFYKDSKLTKGINNEKHVCWQTYSACMRMEAGMSKKQSVACTQRMSTWSNEHET